MTFSATKHIELFQRCFMDTLNTKVELLATVRPSPRLRLSGGVSARVGTRRFG